MNPPGDPAEFSSPTPFLLVWVSGLQLNTMRTRKRQIKQRKGKRLPKPPNLAQHSCALRPIEEKGIVSTLWEGSSGCRVGVEGSELYGV